MAALFKKLFKKNRPSKTTAPSNSSVRTAHSAASEVPTTELDQVSRVQTLQELEPFLNLKTSTVREAAIKRLEEMVFQGATSPQAREQQLQAHQDSQAVKMIALWHEDEETRRLAIACQLSHGTPSQSEILAWIEQSPVSRTRQTLAEYITEVPLLEQLYQQFRSKDKSLSRIAKDRLKELQEAREAREQQLAHQNKIVGSLEQLAKSAYSPSYSAQALHAQQQWQQIPSAEQDPQLSTRFKTALEQAQQQIDAHQAEEKAREALEQSLANAKRQHQALLEEATSVLKAQQDEPTPISSTLSDLQRRWSEACALAKPKTDIKNAFQATLKPLVQLNEGWSQFEQHQEALTQLLEESQANPQALDQLQPLSQLIKSIQWPNAIPAPQLLSQALDFQNRLLQQLESQKGDEKQIIKAYKDATKQLKQSLEDKVLKSSQKHHHQASNALKRLRPHVAERFQVEFKTLTAQLNELRDWQGFATLPKKEELCQQMEALMDADMHPESLASAIQALQTEWKSLGGGDPKVNQALWDRFKQASDQAYEPCRAHFHEQSDIRQRHFEARTQICEELAQLLSDESWDRSNWKAIQSIIEGARVQWRTHSPVDRQKNKALQTRFHDLLDQLRELVNQVFTENAAAKAELVEKAEKLLHLEDLKQATEQAKQLQQEWKTLGNAGQQDHTLWKSFREHCDQLFSNREAEHNARKSAIQANIEQAEALVKEAELLLEQQEIAPAQRQKTLKTLQESFQKIQLPKGVHHALIKKLDRVKSDLGSEQLHKKLNDFFARWKALRHKAGIVHQLEHHIQAQDNVSIEALTAEYQTLTELPKGAENILDKRWQKALKQAESNNSWTQDLLSQHEAALTLLCIRLEILADVESPASDREKRMEYQVQKLAEGIGQAATTSPLAAAQGLELEWHQVGPVTTEVRGPLEIRFFSLMDQVIENIQKKTLS